MIKIALTGSIGMGKSTVARMFEEQGIALFDADAVVRTLQGPSGALVGPISEHFPAVVENGRLDRDKLAQIVLEDPAKLTELEAIVHPAVRDARKAFVAAHRTAPALLFEIPLLFETGGDEAFDKVVVVSAPAAVQRARVLARPGMSEAKFRSILSRQLTDQEKRRRADFVIDTGANLSTTKTQVEAIIACLGLTPGE
jgi:dephospho-CoA kinase